MRRDTAQVSRFADVESLAAAYDTSDVEFVRLSPTTFTAELTQLDLGGIRVRLARFGSPSGEAHPTRPIGLVRGGWRAGRAALFLPVGPATGSIANGHAWSAVGTVMLAPGGEIHNVAVARHQDWAAVDLDADTLAAMMDESGLPALSQGAPRSISLWQRGRFAALQAAILGSVRDAVALPPGLMVGGVLSALRDSVMNALLAAFATMAGDDLALSRQSRASLRIVTAADQLLRADPARPIYTDTLCAALAVSPSKLFNAYRAAYRISPHQFLKCRRLSMARQALRAAAPGHDRVKQAALAHGFFNLGRFAAEYRAMFGEMPSQTLARGTP
jgi:AraC family ethanolamine operon transcriptional activator